jgi:ankyrin repeat protein
MDAETLAFLQGVFELVRAGDNEQLAPLLEGGLPPNLRNHKGDSLLMLASYHGHHALSELLLTHGADPELANDQAQTPLQGAAFKGDLDMARLLLAHGAHVEGRAFEGGKTALTFAAMFGRTDLVEELLAHGADPRARDADGTTPLDAARMMGAHDTAAQLERVLAQHGADPSTLN